VPFFQIFGSLLVIVMDQISIKTPNP
jgi:hypothetical protein